ncbi:MAG TPA: radical SAM family heme chaperone HemW [Terriglobales bacterium]|nr:radical SAM family heme chaperone HemW [Terriglobales bacterium]
MALGLYISVPFCRTKCSYCNFASDVFSRALFDRYVERVCADIRNAPATAERMGGRVGREVDSVYLGGGTPTVLDSLQLERLFVTIGQNFCLLPETEITVECAPGTLNPATLEVLQKSGVNRVSLGVQSFIDQEAAAVGRLHKRTTVLEEIARLRSAGISNINIDLIAGLPHQTRESWDFSLAETLATGAPHASVYMLEVDEDSRLGRELIAGGTRYHAHFVPDEDLTADLYLMACEQLDSAGVRHYEISNFAREGFESRHNLKYWARRPYLGFGVDAHSMLEASDDPYVLVRAAEGNSRKDVGGSPACELPAAAMEAVRFATADSVEEYMGGAPVERTPVSRRAALEETFFLGLRLTRGVDLRQVASQFGSDVIIRFAPQIGELVESGLIEEDGDVVRLTARGRLLSNEVFERFISVAEDVSKP